MSETSIIIDHNPTKRTQFAPWQAFNNTSAQLDIILLILDLSFTCSLDTCINPLSPNSDQQQFSPNNIHTLSSDEVMRIN